MFDQEQYDRAFGMLKGPKKSESLLQLRCCRLLRESYPHVWFHSSLDGEDHGRRGEMIQDIQKEPGYPDLIIIHSTIEYNGFALELKKDSPYRKRDGRLSKSKHIQQQKKWLDKFAEIGFYTSFLWEIKEFEKLCKKYFLINK